MTEQIVQNMVKQSIRAQLVERRTYLRPLDSNGETFETPEQSWDRVIAHQRWLWERAKGGQLTHEEEAELAELKQLFMDRKVTVSGRTRWLGGTDVAKQRESSQFNCSFMGVHTVYDVVDGIWLLLQGCGVGFIPETGILSGFINEIPEIEIIRSQKELPKDKNGKGISDPALKGNPNTVETFDKSTGVWKIILGDSAEAWAKFFGKLLAFKKNATKLIIDFSEIRPAGYRLSGYGWISSGDEQISIAVQGIFKIMNEAAGDFMSSNQIHEIMNHLGTILSSRRSAEMGMYVYGGPEWKDFAVLKKDYFKSPETAHRGMSNNSLQFWQKPTYDQLVEIFDLMEAAGGAEPGFYNAYEAARRAKYFKGTNPCGEILLGDKSFCNLVETVVSRFNGQEEALHRAHYLVARANYRQTCVDLDDGVLQRSWHELNEFIRLCGVGVTGAIGWEGVENPIMLNKLRRVANDGANSMADELGLPRPYLVTTVKPSGTQSKVSGLEGDEVGEGIHKPLGRYIFNNVIFPRHDPLCFVLDVAGYESIDHPSDASARVYKLPVEFSNMDFDTVTKTIRGEEVEVEVNLESAVDQLERYKLWMDNYVDHNCSVTISYDLDEVPAIIDWLLENWDHYVGVSFLYRNDPTKTAADLGFPYLPQEVVDEKTFKEYTAKLYPVDLSGTDIEEMIDFGECATGGCPVR